LKKTPKDKAFRRKKQRTFAAWQVAASAGE